MMASSSPHEIRYAETSLPTIFGTFRCIVYRLFDGLEHVALIKGSIENCSGVLTRIHSECLTGEVFSSLRCDCKQQLNQGLSLIAEEDCGLLLYLRQEGRGIGLGNKIRAYHLQESGIDTVDANRLLGFPDDGRDFHCALRILRDLDVASIRLLTNNPSKVDALVDGGIHVVERIPLVTEVSIEALSYMQAKSRRLGHLIGPAVQSEDMCWFRLDEQY